jgi:hypothetical protein
MIAVFSELTYQEVTTLVARHVEIALTVSGHGKRLATDTAGEVVIC